MHQWFPYICSRTRRSCHILLYIGQREYQLGQSRLIGGRSIEDVAQFGQLRLNIIAQCVFQFVCLIAHHGNDIVDFAAGRKHLQQTIM